MSPSMVEEGDAALAEFSQGIAQLKMVVRVDWTDNGGTLFLKRLNAWRWMAFACFRAISMVHYIDGA